MMIMKIMMDSSKLLICVCMLLLFATTSVECYIGINWGRMATQRMIPSMVIDMLLQNRIPEVKIYAASKNVISAFAGTDIGLTITIPNDDLKNITNVQEAKKWVDDRVTAFVRKGVKIRYVTVGSQPFSSTYFNKTYYHAVDVLKHMQTALDESDFGNRGIKATMSHFTDILNDVKKPSQGAFRENVKDMMVRSLQIMNENNAPVWLDIFPIYHVKQLFDNDIEFAFFDNNSTSAFMDGDKKYNNVFEVMYDTFAVASEKAGFPNLKVIVGQVGWPTDGIDGANIQNAQRFHKGFIRHILSGKGTPRRDGPIDALLHNIADENKLNVMRGDFMRHWGIYRFDGKPKYDIDFSGQGRDIKPVSAKGITHMPKRWCVYSNKSTDMANLKQLYDFACNVSDCTSMAPGGSCSDLEFPQNISYAFNMYFQSKGQKVSEGACEFEGLGAVVPDDPSTKTCSFPVEILSAELFGGNGLVRNSISAGGTHNMASKITIGFLFSLILLALV